MIALILFFITFLSTGIYFTLEGTEYAFYQISPVTMLLPCIILGIIISGKGAIDKFVKGTADQQIISMVIIFLLAGALTSVTKAIGGVEAIVNLILDITPIKFVIPSIFIISALLGIAMGTSMGVISAVTPVALEIAHQIESYNSICVATVIGGAMFGDNLSLISDTTIASVNSQSASLIKKFKINVIFSSISAVITILILMCYSMDIEVDYDDYSILRIVPYFIVIGLALLRVHVFTVLVLGILSAGMIGLASVPDYNIILYSKQIYAGFLSVHEVMLLSLLIGGLIFLAKEKGLPWIVRKLRSLILGKKSAKLIIAALVSISDILLANNTIAILFTGKIAKEIAKENRIKPHEAAFLLDSFSCVFQGIIPHGAQIILASSLSGVNPLLISSQVFFCYIMATVTIIYITFSRH